MAKGFNSRGMGGRGGMGPMGGGMNANMMKQVQKMQQEMARIHALHRQQLLTDTKSKRNMEFRVGVHIFGFLGGVFILAAFVIFGFNFLDGLAQGLCLYGIAIIFVVLSELLLIEF